jgi:hypothetical protein
MIVFWSNLHAVDFEADVERVLVEGRFGGSGNGA